MNALTDITVQEKPPPGAGTGLLGPSTLTVDSNGQPWACEPGCSSEADARPGSLGDIYRLLMMAR